MPERIQAGVVAFLEERSLLRDEAQTSLRTIRKNGKFAVEAGVARGLISNH